MTEQDAASWRHEHVFDQSSQAAERRTRLVMWITAATMIVEIAAGWLYNSMALLADGWHMSSHALAIGLSAFAYGAARKYARDPRFAFGTWKIEVLAGYTSAVLLLGIALLMAFGSVERLFAPEPIHYREAIVIAAVGLVVNVVCAIILGGAHHHHDHGHDHGHHHGHAHHHDHDHGHHHHDLNLKAAYVHVIADAATSVLAIAALYGGWLYGWDWLDPVMGCAGAVLVAVWAKRLIRDTGKVLLDREMDAPVVAEIREAIESERVVLADLHVWRVGRQSYACALAVVTSDTTVTPAGLRDQLAIHEEIVHSTIEVHHRVA
nr:CDF family Co(II)/Ni(II) efflux transporter DmeF [Pseudoduganella flava]